jgi:hypothetical protein
MRERIKALPLLEIGMALVFLALVGTFAYGAVTGKTLTDNAEYNAAGRVFQAICALGFAFISWRTLKTLTSLRSSLRKAQDGGARKKAEEDAPPPSIDYEEKG